MIKQYVVDAFTGSVFRGNPAAICILDKWVSERLMMDITIENNLSETAFAVKTGVDRYHLRWFTPGGEIDLCGHATLATAFVLMNYYEPEMTEVVFDTLSGELAVKRVGGTGAANGASGRVGDMYELNFPAYKLKQVDVTEEMVDAIGIRPQEAWMGRDLLCVFKDQDEIRRLNPDMGKLMNLPGLLLQTTAPGQDPDEFHDCMSDNQVDSVSRTFAPKLGVPEDPVCGSGHCHIVPYWANRLQKEELACFQASRRSGMLYCRVEGDRVVLAGKAALYSVAELQVDEE